MPVGLSLSDRSEFPYLVKCGGNKRLLFRDLVRKREEGKLAGDEAWFKRE